jgi:hypothetical protein
MGKRTKSREAQRIAVEQAITARLRAHSTTRSAASVETLSDLPARYRAKIETYRTYALRAPEQWRCVLRRRSAEMRFLELVRFTFAKYPVARHLEKVWIEATPNGHPELPDFHRWYIVVAQGGSLYRHAAHAYMSKLETHHFLTAPAVVDTPTRAFWYAFARAQVGDNKLVLKIARTKIVGVSPLSSFWQDVARYFARNPTSIPEMNDLLDYFQAAHEADVAFTLAGRTLPALRRRMEEWHRQLRQQQTLFSATWPGVALPNVEYQTYGEHGCAIWRFKQIRSEYELFKEGESMHHCVLNYTNGCLRKDISIWSLTREYPLTPPHRRLTIEVHRDRAITQCRGFANRLPYVDELRMVKRWAADYGLSWPAAGP